MWVPEGKDDVCFLLQGKGCISEGGPFPLLHCEWPPGWHELFCREWLSAGPERTHTAPGEQLVSVPRALGTHLRQRTRLKAVPGRGGGEWLRRGWGPEDGLGTRVSVRSPVYVGLTAFVSKAAKGEITDDVPRGSAGKKGISEWLRLRDSCPQ